MIITHTDKANTTNYAYLSVFPDQFKLDKEKKSEDFIKSTMDYFANYAYSQYKNNKQVCKNYDLLKGILRREDFYEEPEVKSFTDVLIDDLELPAYVKHYPILNPPINDLVGELANRPDVYRAKAMDDDSKSEELQFKTEILHQYIIQEVQKSIKLKLAAQGVNPDDIDPQEFQQLTLDQVKDYMTDYTSLVERWANKTLESCKVEFNMKEKGEEAFRDTLAVSSEFFHIYEDNSKVGFNIEVANKKNVWGMSTPDKKYTFSWYAGGLVEVMEISQIIETFPDLTKKEIDHLRKSRQDYGILGARESNLHTSQTGIETIKYDTYNPLIEQERMILESEIEADNSDSIRDILGLSNIVSSFGYKYVVVRGYWISKKFIREVKYLDEEGQIQTLLADENYKPGTIPTEIEITDGWINQWYQGVKIGQDVYHVKPFKLLDRMPIIGVTYEIKNTQARSLVDLMKPFQVLYNICMNQLFSLLGKEKGKVIKVQLRRIPVPKDGDAQDAIEIWEQQARERGIVFEDDSPENLKTQISNTQTTSVLDLELTNQISSRYELAAALKNECWELVGLSKQRLGSVSASETATATNTAVTRSYAQTEPYFAQHEYVMNQVYQAMLDAAKYIESKKPVSTLSYITSEGDSAFIEVDGNDLKLKDLHVFVTSRPEDQKQFNEIRSLSQAILQNGGDAYDIIQLYSTNSLRQMKKVFKTLKDKKEQYIQQQQQNTENEQKLKEQEIVANIQSKQIEAEKDREHESYENALDRESKKEIALLNAYGKNENALQDNNNNGLADALEVTRNQQEQSNALREHNLKQQEIDAKEKERLDKLFLEMQKIALEKEKIKKDYEIQKLRNLNPVVGEKKPKKPKK